MDIDECYDELKKCQPYEEVIRNKFPSDPGIYCFFFKDNQFPFPQLKIDYPDFSCEYPMYIGISQNLKKRDYNTHFNGKTSKSTLRRSIGALFIEKWKLKPIPRSRSRNRNSFYNYSFIKENEEEISKRIQENLKIGFYIEKKDDNLKKMEMQLINSKKPVLNIIHSTNTKTVKELKKLRKECSERAKHNSE